MTVDSASELIPSSCIWCVFQSRSALQKMFLSRSPFTVFLDIKNFMELTLASALLSPCGQRGNDNWWPTPQRSQNWTNLYDKITSWGPPSATSSVQTPTSKNCRQTWMNGWCSIVDQSMWTKHGHPWDPSAHLPSSILAWTHLRLALGIPWQRI